MAERRGATLEASGISVAFGGLQALADVNLKVGPGEIVGVLGPNGAGKTTFLNVISRFQKIKPEGALSYGDVDLLSCRPRKLASIGISRTFQHVEVSPFDRLWANVVVGGHVEYTASFGARLPVGRARREVDAKVERAARRYLEIMQLDQWASARMQDVPFAVRKRAEICRALLANPTLLLLDEPASGLSSPEKQQLQGALRDIHDELGIAFLMIEHDVGFLTGLCQRLVALNFGRLIADGPTAAVVEDPAVIEAYLGAPDDA